MRCRLCCVSSSPNLFETPILVYSIFDFRWWALMSGEQVWRSFSLKGTAREPRFLLFIRAFARQRNSFQTPRYC